KDITNLLKFSHVFVFPSYREGLSVSVMEAMAMGKPVIASKIRGNNDLIDEGKGGYLFNPKDTYKLASLILNLIEEQGLTLSLGSYNKLKIKDYSIEKVLEKVEQLYFEKPTQEH